MFVYVHVRMRTYVLMDMNERICAYMHTRVLLYEFVKRIVRAQTHKKVYINYKL